MLVGLHGYLRARRRPSYLLVIQRLIFVVDIVAEIARDIFSLNT